MAIWIITTGNSDVRIKKENNWNTIFHTIRDNLECTDFASPIPINPNAIEEGYTLPARVLGVAYSQIIEQEPKYFDELEFPLIETFCQKLKSEKKLEKKSHKLEQIFVLTTDQNNLFPNKWDRINEKCPYWQDTIELQTLLEKYLKTQFDIPIEFISLCPNSDEGLDYWDATLKLVETEFSQKFAKLQDKIVYVSHQAGTPAISAAVQFASLGIFGKVEFLVSNQYYDASYNHQAKAKIIDSSEYWRGLQIQKAKPLIRNGFPSTALKLLDGIDRIDKNIILQLEQMVDFFNLKSQSQNTNPDSIKEDFGIPNATQRIVDGLDLIGFFFKQNNYLPGISLLAAAQETFLKVAIKSEIQKNTANYCGIPVAELVKWTTKGLISPNNDELRNILKLPNSQNIDKVRNDIFDLLKFPYSKHNDRFYLYSIKQDLEFSRTGMLEWLLILAPNFREWAHLRQSNLRNQVIHNLRGIEEEEVIAYLLGLRDYQPIPNNITTAMDAYIQKVKQPFMQAIVLLKLPCEKGKLQERLNAIADSLI
ncbi:hypothetical protein [Calothrix sp. PCC 6303]|uniref:hypothetical protein n=1 Tax=Calothrix sp. PCC 6303 TaxID=1170562 RepID=UPI0002A00F35|nr:hypothetical protein [Calothrix sp. PCC 6303]AFY99376.1 hypothetical protein Cal6303_0282 [Calothrix sp. PCC 6303]